MSGANTVTVIDDRTAKVVDSQGRTFTVKTIGAVQRMKLFAAAGPEKSLVDRYLAYCMIGASVTSIDDVPVPFPRSSGEIEAIVGRLDDHGVEAVAEALAALTPKGEEVADAARNL